MLHRRHAPEVSNADPRASGSAPTRSPRASPRGAREACSFFFFLEMDAEDKFLRVTLIKLKGHLWHL